jgi:predicted nucleotidyltransferase
MNLDAITEKIKGSIPSLMAVYLFGSRANETAGPGSDLDIAVLAEDRLDPVELFSLAGDIGLISRCPVDLVDMRVASTVMKYLIITSGKTLWRRDWEVDLYECFILSSKTELDELRAGLLEDIAKEGRVYGGRRYS